MEIRRFFVNAEDVSGSVVTLSGGEFEHMTRVLRYKKGYKAVVCPNDGRELYCTVKEIYDNYATLFIDDEKTVDARRVSVTLYAGLLKNNKLDLVVQKAVELGIDRIIPFTSERSAETSFNPERANKIASEAAKQCRAAYLSEVLPLIAFSEVVSDMKSYDTAVIAYELERKTRIADICFNGCNVALVVGPEGGFSEAEIDAAISGGAQKVTLGKRILRAETADIVLAAFALQAMGELDYD